VSIHRVSLAIVISAALLAPSAFGSRVHRSPTSGQPNRKTTQSAQAAKSVKGTKSAKGTRTTKATKASKTAPKKRGQQAIAPERVTEIQQALIREHYLSGDATGQWDSTTQAAMQKFQADQGWQTRLMPDSRALKKLGLGPDYSNAINAKDSSFAAPPPISTIPTEQASGFAAAAGVNP
jgi:hypothetical protein